MIIRRLNGWSRALVFACAILLFAGLGNAQGNGKGNQGNGNGNGGPANGGNGNGNGNQGKGNGNGNGKHGKTTEGSMTPPGLLITSTALPNATQQDLIPGFALTYFSDNYPDFAAGQAVKGVVSPDGTTLAVLTAGMNSLYYPNTDDLTDTNLGKIDVNASTQFLFLYDITNKTAVLKQVLQQINSHVGLVWAPNSQTIYTAGGCDDVVYVYGKHGNSFGVAQSPKFTAPLHSIPGSMGNAPDSKISLHPAPTGCSSTAGIGLSVAPNASGLAISADGGTLVVANNYNDSISIINTTTATAAPEYDLRPYSTSGAAFNGIKGGTFPYSVALKSTAAGLIAYVGSDRDREIIIVNTTTKTLVGRIQLDGNPNGMTMSADGSKLFVAQDNQDQVAVVDTASNTIIHRIDTRGPASLAFPQNTTGASPMAVTINPANNTLYAVNSGSNSIAVIPLTGPDAFTTTALLPTAYDPTDIAFSADGSWMYIVNGKNDTGPNPLYGYGNMGVIQFKQFDPPETNAQEATELLSNNQYQFQLEHAGLVSAQVPDSSALFNMTSQVAANNGYTPDASTADQKTMDFLHDKIKHIIYIVKENRTFDQILGDLGNGSNGDPSLTLFGQGVTPSFHRISSNFVTLDNFMDPGDGSMDGWSWSMRGRVTNTETLSQQINYARVNRGLSYEGEGQNRNIPSNLNTVAERDLFFDPTGATTPYTTRTSGLKGGTPNILAGDGDHAATDGPTGYQQGYIFNAVLNAGLTIRNYGWMANTPGNGTDNPASITTGNPLNNPFAAGVIVTTAANQVIAGPSENGFFDPYFRAYDQSYPDVWRFQEWNREFQQFVANGNLPALEMIRGISHDHTGNFTTALGGVNTPELQQADNDYAVGLLVQAVANSPYAKDTLIIVIEDDSQDGADHVDSHRATTYFVGPYVKHNVVVNTPYSQPNVLRTIEDILGTEHINLNTYYAAPMADLFDTKKGSDNWTFQAVASTLLAPILTKPVAPISAAGGLGLNPSNVVFALGVQLKPTHDPQYWASRTAGFDFSGEDRVPKELYNKILWEGIKGTPAPAVKTQFAKAKADADDDDDDGDGQ